MPEKNFTDIRQRQQGNANGQASLQNKVENDVQATGEKR